MNKNDKSRVTFEEWCKEYRIDTSFDPISGYCEKTSQLWDFFRHGRESRDDEVEEMKCCGNCGRSLIAFGSCKNSSIGDVCTDWQLEPEKVFHRSFCPTCKGSCHGHCLSTPCTNCDGQGVI